MSETEDPRRSRRRASRTVGPPVGEGATGQPTTGETRDTAAPVSTPASSSPQRAASNRSAGTSSTSAKTAKVSTEKTVPSSVTPGSSGAESAESAESSTDADTSGATDATDPSVEPTTERIARTGSGGLLSRLPFTSKRRKDTESSNQVSADPGSAKSGADDRTVAHSRAAEADSHSEADADDSAENKPRRSKKAVLASAAAVVLVLGMVSVAVLSVFAVQSTEERDTNRAEYVQTARQTVINLTTISADSAKEDIQRVLTMASGEFKTEFDGRIDPFTEIVKQAKVTSNGEVIEAAIENEDEKSARVLIAAKQTLTNAGQEEPQNRFYRFRVTVTRGDDGNLSASNVEFVA